MRVPSEASASPSAAFGRELKPDINSNEPKSKSKSNSNPKFEVQHTPESENKSRIESKPITGTFAKSGRKKRRSINTHGLSHLSSESSSDEYVPSDDSGDEHSKRPAHRGRVRDEDERSKGGGKKGAKRKGKVSGKAKGRSRKKRRGGSDSSSDGGVSSAEYSERSSADDSGSDDGDSGSPIRHSRHLTRTQVVNYRIPRGNEGLREDMDTDMSEEEDNKKQEQIDLKPIPKPKPKPKGNIIYKEFS